MSVKREAGAAAMGSTAENQQHAAASSSAAQLHTMVCYACWLKSDAALIGRSLTIVPLSAYIRCLQAADPTAQWESRLDRLESKVDKLIKLFEASQQLQDTTAQQMRAEQAKLAAEQAKLAAEQAKLAATVRDLAANLASTSSAAIPAQAVPASVNGSRTFPLKGAPAPFLFSANRALLGSMSYAANPRGELQWRRLYDPSMRLFADNSRDMLDSQSIRPVTPVQVPLVRSSLQNRPRRQPRPTVPVPARPHRR